jgi:hypothetical protein
MLKGNRRLENDCHTWIAIALTFDDTAMLGPCVLGINVEIPVNDSLHTVPFLKPVVCLKEMATVELNGR